MRESLPFRTPDECVSYIWGSNTRLEAWQKKPFAQALKFLVDGRPDKQLFLCITGAHGTGKTQLMSLILVLSVIILEVIQGTRFNGSLFSGNFKSLNTVLLPEIRYWAEKSRFGSQFREGTSMIGFRESLCSISPKAWDKKDYHKVAGTHGEVLINAFDESSTIPREVFNTIYGGTSDRKVLFIIVGNSDKDVGFVYDLFNYNSGRFKLYQIPHTCLTFRRNRDFEDRLRELYGEDSDEYRVKVLGQFPRFSSDTFIPRAFIEASRERVPAERVGRNYKMSVDVGSGEGVDPSVILLRDGAKIVYVWRRTVLIPVLKMKIHEVCARLGLTTFAIDEVGIGMGLVQELRATYPGLVAVNGAEKARNISRFYNRRAELYYDLKEWIISYGHIPKGGVFDVLVEEIVSIKHEYRNGRILMQSKKEMKKSPDIADALAYTFAVPDIALDNSYVNVLESSLQYSSAIDAF